MIDGWVDIQPCRTSAPGEVFSCEEHEADCFIVFLDGDMQDIFTTREEAAAEGWEQSK